MKVSGTVAKEIALYFFLVTEQRYTSAVIAKTINQAKQLLESGYTANEIKKTIDYIVNNTSTKMYSLGYINTCINKVLEDVKAKEKEEEIQRIIAQQKEDIIAIDKEVENDKPSERNRNKLNGFGFKSRFGEEFDFDLHKE